eukprot:tig00000113_g5648.t1
MAPRATKRGREDDSADNGSSSTRARLSGAASQPPAAAAPEESCPIIALPDELLLRILFLAARRKWWSQPACAGMSQLDLRENAPDARPELLQRFRAVCRRFRSLCEDPRAWERVALWNPSPSARPRGTCTLFPTPDLSGLPIALEHLESLRGLAPTLRALSVDLCPEQSSYNFEPVSYFTVLSDFRALERLRVEFWRTPPSRDGSEATYRLAPEPLAPSLPP